METKHTKGEWFVGEDIPNGLTELKNHIAILTDKWDIACVFTDAGDDLDEPKYNAKLIAAAPELLEALIEIVKSVKYGTSGEMILNKSGYINALTAIKKATE